MRAAVAPPFRVARVRSNTPPPEARPQRCPRPQFQPNQDGIPPGVDDRQAERGRRAVRELSHDAHALL